MNIMGGDTAGDKGVGGTVKISGGHGDVGGAVSLISGLGLSSLSLSEEASSSLLSPGSQLLISSPNYLGKSGEISLVAGSGGLSLRTLSDSIDGDLSLSSSDGDSGSNLLLRAGAGFRTGGGNISIFSGDGPLLPGFVRLGAGSSSLTRGGTLTLGHDLDLESSASHDVSGYVSISSGNSISRVGNVELLSGGGFSSGLVDIQTGRSSQDSGAIRLTTGSSYSGGASGTIVLSSGIAEQSAGDILLSAGDSMSSVGGSLFFSAGGGAIAGDMRLTSGHSSLGVGGSLDIVSGNSPIVEGGSGSVAVATVSSVGLSGEISLVYRIVNLEFLGLYFCQYW